MKVLVCGGRDYTDRIRVYAKLGELRAKGLSYIIHGGARGVDEFAGDWGHGFLVPVRVFHADWERHGKRAGPIRNQQMIDEGRPDLVVAFPGGAGTADMVRRARKAGIDVIESDS